MSVDDATVSLMACVMGGLSMLGALLIIVSFVCFKELRTLARLHLVCLSIADFGQGLFFVFSSSSWTTSKCDFFTPFGIFFASSSFLWTDCVAFFVYRVAKETNLSMQRYTKWFNIIGWGFPLIVSLLPLAFNLTSDDNDENWCYIPVDPKRYALSWFLRFISVYGVLWLSWFFTCLMYYLTYKNIRKIERLVSPTTRPSSALIQKKMIFIPAVFFLLRLWESLRRIFQIFDYYGWDWLAYPEAMCDPAQGFVNAIFFGFTNKSVVQAFKKRFDIYIMKKQNVSINQPLLSSPSSPNLSAELGHDSPLTSIERK